MEQNEPNDAVFSWSILITWSLCIVCVCVCTCVFLLKNCAGTDWNLPGRLCDGKLMISSVHLYAPLMLLYSMYLSLERLMKMMRWNLCYCSLLYAQHISANEFLSHSFFLWQGEKPLLVSQIPASIWLGQRLSIYVSLGWELRAQRGCVGCKWRLLAFV